MAFSTFLILSGFLIIISAWIYFIIQIFRGKVKWGNANDDAFMPPKNTFDPPNPFEDSERQRRMCDAVNISHGHSPGVPYVRS